MTDACVLALLAFVDGGLCGFRAAAGRDGSIGKRGYYLRAVMRATLWAMVGTAIAALVAWLLVITATEPIRAWITLRTAGHTLVLLYGGFATVTLMTLGFYVAPIGDYRVLTSVLVLGPLTLVRPLVIAGGLAFVSWRSGDLRVTVMAGFAALIVLSWERLLGRRYASMSATPSSLRGES